MQITRTLNIRSGTLIVQILMMLLFMCDGSQAQTVSYWFQGWQRKPDAQQAAAYFMVPGANVTFTYQTNRVIINSSGGGVGGNLQLFGDVTSPLTALPNVTTTLKNTGTAGTYVKTTFDAQGRETSGVTTLGNADLVNSSVTYNGVTVALGASGTLQLSGVGGDFLNEGTTTTVLHGNAAGTLSFGAVDLANDVSGNLGVTHLNSGTDADNTHYWRGDGTWATIPAAAAQTNIYATNLIGFLAGTNTVFTTNASGFLSINNGIDTNLLTPLTYSQGVSNYTVSVSNLFKSISISNVIFSDDGVTNQAGFGTSSKSYGVAIGFNAVGGDYGISIGNSSGGGLRGVAVGGSTIAAPDGVAIGYGAQGPGDSVAVGHVATAAIGGVGIGHVSSAANYGVAIGRYATVDGIGSAAIGGTDTSGNKAQVPAAWNDTIELARGVATLQGGLNFRGMGILDSFGNAFSSTLTPTNGIIQQTYKTNGTLVCVTNKQFYLVYGTNELITLPNASLSTVSNIIYRFSTTNGYGSFIITNATGTQTIRDGVSLSYTNIGINEVGFISDGASWWLASKGKQIFPSASWSLSSNITPIQDAITNIPFSDLEFNNSQGIALKTNAAFARPTQLWVTNAGTYLITFSAVLRGPAGGGTISLWLRKGGTDVPRTRTDQIFAGTTSQVTMTVNFFQNVGAPDFFELVAASHNANPPTIESGTANPTGYTAPAMPSIIVTINRVSDTWP